MGAYLTTMTIAEGDAMPDVQVQVTHQVIVLCINDGAVMDAWADHQQVGRDGEGTMITSSRTRTATGPTRAGFGCATMVHTTTSVKDGASVILLSSMIASSSS